MGQPGAIKSSVFYPGLPTRDRTTRLADRSASHLLFV